MSIVFRVILLIISLLSAGYTFSKIRKSQMLVSDAIFWLLLSISFVILSVFPEIAIKGSALLGVESPANFIFLTILFIIIIKLFTLSIDVSVFKSKLKLLIEEYAIREYKEENGSEGFKNEP